MPSPIYLIVVPATGDGLKLAIGEGHRRYTRRVNFKATWFPEDMEACCEVDTWDGIISSKPVDDKK